ncbi:hypothetical protein OCO_15660 [Mycobacterium intracellulare MOTT-02]|uniref:hypothetical protein n=1 Tax=Mycobacterium intracellulare TaxID=1767 RepID=UPI0002529641|nr:hypothetical protein [Mycobacterium intracellulare]AFC47929.1 hypothetical protein OCO_15660 [Mycobacterium intracellulare MOTT-02]MDM3896673.1 hypothetical protein [Mycobacterium intracellulare]BCP36199.1 hypothetical protein MINTMi198_15690 [Mycobacterium intracellulare M.i.198]
MPLHSDALVVRAGKVRDVETLKEKVDEAIEDGDGAVISVFCDVRRTDNTEGMTLHELCAESEVVHTKVQVTTVARLREQGFEPILNVSNGQRFTHHHVVLADPVQESTLQAFIDCFGEPIANPAGGKRKRSQ